MLSSQQPYDAKEFILAKDNSFYIELSVMDYADPDRVVYQYRFDGDKWNGRACVQVPTLSYHHRTAYGTHHFMQGGYQWRPDICTHWDTHKNTAEMAFVDIGIYYLFPACRLLAYTVYIYGKKRV